MRTSVIILNQLKGIKTTDSTIQKKSLNRTKTKNIQFFMTSKMKGFNTAFRTLSTGLNLTKTSYIVQN